MMTSRPVSVHALCAALLVLLVGTALQPAAAQLTPDVCPNVWPAGVSWALIKDYDNANATRYGDLNTTLCECMQACLSLPGCSGFDWYLKGKRVYCWIASNCPVTGATLEYDVTNLHYIPMNMEYCYPSATVMYGTGSGTVLKTSCRMLFFGIFSALYFALKNWTSD